jgi:hypothetical protein
MTIFTIEIALKSMFYSDFKAKCSLKTLLLNY